VTSKPWSAKHCGSVRDFKAFNIITNENGFQWDSYSLPDTIRMTNSWEERWGRHATFTGGTVNAYRLLVDISEGKRKLGRRGLT
jgi:hypothetical protein